MPRPQLPSQFHRLAAWCFCCALVQLVVCHASFAARYEVHVPATIDWPGWWSPVKGGPFSTGNMRVDSQSGSFTSGEYRRWRLLSPGTTQIAGGRLSLRSRTSTPGMVAQVRTGSDGGASRVLWQSGNDGDAHVPIVSGNDWIEFGLAATADATTTRASADAVVASSIDLIMVDNAAPLLRLTTAPDEIEWYGPEQCAPWSLVSSDTGSGVTKVMLRSQDTASIIDSWRATLHDGLAPGELRMARSGCINATSAVHGRNTFTVSTSDHAGLERVTEIQARFDLSAPILALSAESQRTVFDSSLPTWQVNAVDADSGMDTVSASINTIPAEVMLNGSTMDIHPAQRLDVGEYVLHVRARDKAGNSAVIDRNFTIVDTTSPTITVTAPGDHGSSTPWIAASATDSGSGVVPSSWQVIIDGRACDAASADSTLAGPLGTLTAGTHTIVIIVRDAAGNTARVTRNYEVDTPTDTAVTAIPDGRSGLFVQGAIPTVYQLGASIRIPVVAADHGRPLSGYHVQLRRRGRLLDDAVSDASGLVLLHSVADHPGSITIQVAGSNLPAQSIPIRVAPRIVIRTSATSMPVGTSIIIRGRLRPATNRRRLRLYANVGGSWYPLQRRITVGARGGFRSSVQSSVPGRIAVQARIGAHGGWSSGASNVVWISVR